MKHNINAEIISIGTEILLGEITDTNSVFIARQLRDLGINLYFMTSVGDNRLRIADAIRIALSRARVVITCGGLGPTVDDMTRQSVADATERELVFHQVLLDQIKTRFQSFHVNMTANNRQQAYLPAGAIAIENPVGTAPSFAVEHRDAVVISLPGVPREMKFLMTEKVIPYLHSKYDLGVIKARVLKTAGIGESMLDELIGRDLLEMSNPTIGLAAHNGQVDVRITAKADTLDSVNAMIQETEILLTAKIADYVFGYDDDNLDTILISELQSIGGTVAIYEAGIGNAISQLFKNQAGNVLKVAHSYEHPDELRQILAEANITLRELSLRSAQHLQSETQAAVCISVVSLPDVEESADIVEATAVSIVVGEAARTRAYGFGGKSNLARQWVSTWAVAAAWRMLRESRQRA
ncbi:MAG: CinA family nicotinamide mononucleotide deamidase-related protein [Anaerolineae bacterium]|nr:CinA family nicotinamide mononucleotide deamidase-related protein [Anaerolineae bacterium]